MSYPLESYDMHSLSTMHRLIAAHREKYRTEGGEERRLRIAELEQNANNLYQDMAQARRKHHSRQQLPRPQMSL